MSDIRGKISTTSGPIKTRLTSQQELQVSKFTVSTQTQTLTGLSDVNTTNLSDGAMLIYNGTTEVFEARPDVDNPNTKIIGGSF
tara:strand:+ start:7090 stop:7341 length:252 start_codon:yes stop_codon:yes gene_type:complete